MPPKYEARHFNTAANRRRRNMDSGKKLSAVGSLPSEAECLKLFRERVAEPDILLPQCELGRKTLKIRATTADKNLRAEQLRRLSSPLVPPVPGGALHSYSLISTRSRFFY